MKNCNSKYALATSGTLAAAGEIIGASFEYNHTTSKSSWEITLGPYFIGSSGSGFRLVGFDESFLAGGGLKIDYIPKGVHSNFENNFGVQDNTKFTPIYRIRK